MSRIEIMPLPAACAPCAGIGRGPECKTPASFIVVEDSMVRRQFCLSHAVDHVAGEMSAVVAARRTPATTNPEGS